jgi:hypothetical protein
MQKLHLNNELVKQVNTLSYEEEKEVLGGIGPKWDYMGTVKILNTERCVECHTLVIDKLLDFKRYYYI